MRAVAIAVLLAALAVLVPAQDPSAQTGDETGAGGDVARELPWWGPTDPDEGWHLRVPVTVTNTEDYAIQNTPAIADLDLRKLTLDAGWPTRESGDATFLKSFTLQLDSARVVEYTNFQMPRRSPSDAQLVPAEEHASGPERFVIPSIAREGFLTQEQTGAYDASRRPIVSVTWQLDGSLEPGEKRHYMIYLDIEQNGQRPAADQAEVEEALGSNYWINRGTRVFGSGSKVTITAIHDDTTAALYRYEDRRPVPVSRGDGGNTFGLDKGDRGSFDFGDNVRAFTVVASKPVVATGTEGLDAGNSALVTETRQTGFIPSADGGVKGTSFVASVFPPRGGATGDERAQTRAPRFFLYNPGSFVEGTFNGNSFRTSDPVHVFEASGSEVKLTTDSPVLLQQEPHGERYQFADLESGAPTGDHLMGIAHGNEWNKACFMSECVYWWERVSGGVTLGTYGDEATVQGFTLPPNRERVVPGGGPGSSQTSVDLAPGNAVVERTGRAPIWPMEIESVDDGGSIWAIGGPFSNTQTGDRASIASPIGGSGAQTFTAPASVNVFAFHNQTRVQVGTENGTGTSQVLDRGQRLTAEGSLSDPLSIEASRPVAVVPQARVGYGAGLPEGPSASGAAVQYRGYLLELSPASGEEPMVERASFGDNVTFELEVTNLAQDAEGDPLEDTIEFSTTPTPPGWNATLGTKNLTLDGGESGSTTLTVQAPQTRDLGNRLRSTVTARSQNNPGMASRVDAITLLEEHREVGTWFFEREGPQDLAERFDPGQTRTFPLVVENQGSTTDEIGLTLRGVQSGWSASIVENGSTVTSVVLDAKESRTVHLEASAPPSGGLLLPTSLTITGVSLNDSRAADKVLFDGIVRTKSNLGLDPARRLVEADPGSTATFPFTLANEGNATVDVQLNASADTPPGWPDPDFRFEGRSLAPVDNRFTSLPPTGNDPLSLSLAQDVPANATGRLHVKVLVTATPRGSSGGQSVHTPLHLFVRSVAEPEVTEPGTTVVEPDASRVIEVPLTNHGNANATFPVQPVSTPAGWSVTHPREVTVASNDTRSIDVGVGVPAGADPANETLEFQLTSPNGTDTRLRVPVQVPVSRALEIDAPDRRTVVPGVATNLTLPVRNVGNRLATVAVDAQAPDGWRVTQHGPPAELPPLASDQLELAVTPPADAEQEHANVTLDPPASRTDDAVPGDEPAGPSIAFTLRRPDLQLGPLSVLPPAEAEADTPAVHGRLMNTENVTVHDVTVGLANGDEIVAETRIGSVPASGSRVFTLEGPSDLQQVSALSVVADPGDRIPETNEQNNREGVSAEQANAAPGGGVWGAVVAVAVAAAAAGGRFGRGS